ncbi:MAG: hypothetical protein O3A14_01620 [Cyanobacteria bacterium]|nr:hypothetical protein [Cyanobacteriota bacterium]
MQKMVPEAKEKGYEFITLPVLGSIKEALKRHQYNKAFEEIIHRLFGRLLFDLRLILIRDSVILFIHPQISGFKNLLRLIKNNRVYVYVMDNGFFCVRSYNLDPYNQVECLKCVGAPENVLQGCQPYPAAYPKSSNTLFLKSLMTLSRKVVFLAQNQNQRKILKAHFGDDIDCIVVGMNTGEIPLADEPEMNILDENLKYDVVYHGSSHLAKGISYVVQLARYLKEVSFFVPESRESCEIALGSFIECENISFRECRWESGLKSAVSQARLVINPSLWSASIEGALLKSVFYGYKVATVETQYGFEGELSEDINLIRLPHDISLAAKIVKDTLTHCSSTEEPRVSRSKIVDFLNQKSIFDVIDEHLFENSL